jgi:amino acid transporter
VEPQQAVAGEYSLANIALGLVALWSACDIGLGASGVFAGDFRGSLSDLSVLGAFAFVCGLNVAIAAASVGVIDLCRSPRRSIPRALAFACLLPVGIVLSFLLSDWRLGSNDTVRTLRDQHLDGLTTWLVAVAVLVVGGLLLRCGRSTRDASARR